MEQVVSQVLEHISLESSKEHEIDSGALNDTQFKKIESVKKTTAFIDGGNIELLNGNTFCLQLIRTACVVFKDGKKENIKNEFYLFTTVRNSPEGLFFSSTVFPVEGEVLIEVNDLNLSLDDKSLAVGMRLPTASLIGSVARRFAELALAAKVQEDVDLVVLDGNLEQTYTHEENYLGKCNEKVCGLAKTSTVMSQQGGNVAALLNDREGVWNYPSGFSKGLNTSFVKLHTQAKYVFMLQTKGLEDGSALLSHCHDPLFLGYPYGLIYADRMARISNHEKSILLTKLKVKCRNQFKDIEKYLNTSSAHDVLDSIG